MFYNNNIFKALWNTFVPDSILFFQIVFSFLIFNNILIIKKHVYSIELMSLFVV